MKPTEIAELIKNKDVAALRKLISEGTLAVKKGKITYANPAYGKLQEEYWDLEQHTRKISLNSIYGSLLQAGCRFFDKRIGQSTTLTGRQVAKHMAAKVNEIVTGEYDHVGKAVVYGDSVTPDTLILTESGEITIEELYNRCAEHSIVGEKEYGVWSPDKVLGFNSYEDAPVPAEITAVIRHNTRKEIWQVTLSNGKSVKVTEDHSLMADRDGFLLEVKPTEILPTDLFICLDQGTKTVQRAYAAKIESLGVIDDYVYDISIKDQDPLFFGNDCLLKNTDSCYFTAYTTLKKDIDKGSIPWNKETVVQLYDQIATEVNGTFRDFMLEAFHCPRSQGEVIKAGREVVGSKSLFITKKRYAVLVYDKEGKRKDNDDRPGEIKAMGLDLKRSDTPEFMQEFLTKILEKVLTGAEQQEILDMISEFRISFKARPGWEKGSPKRANGISGYQAKETKSGKTTMPGHVRASINWNTLKRMYGDRYSMNISDGAKVIVCKLKDNPLGYTSVAYPVDELRLPQWFKGLPFDHDEMESTIIDNKLENLIGVLHYDLNSTSQKNTFNTLFDF